MTPPTAPSSRRRLLVVLAAVVTLLTAAAVVAALVLTGDDNRDSGQEPVEDVAAAPTEAPDATVRAYLEGAQARDCEVLAAHDVGEYDSVADCEAFFSGADDVEGEDLVELTIADVEVTDQTDQAATVRLQLTQSYGEGADATTYENTVDYTLRNDDGRWNITGFETVQED
ncbi:hypothetical protein [Aeromicrobium sp. Leaf350]|uniref:hypothetical protein n=1 Tax=Aeromicrobium sp. Leaf350 TaxID=2876565 RepID=UPI001E29A9CB|nr:hypothetical protein [Aeromicrobium sp. Leaf350]